MPRDHARRVVAGAQALSPYLGQRMDVPTWLWRSVVELLAAHEAAHLEHCRRFALREAA